MPTYTYQCKKCEAVRDVFHSMSESPRVKCEACGSTRMTRLLGTGAGILFKGSGFYETDYKKNGGSGKNGSKQEGSSEGKSETKSEVKSEGKSESKSTKSEAAKSSSGKGKDS